MNDKQKHLEMIQGVINRFSTNSFLLKGWNVTLLSVLLALSIRNCHFYLVYFAYIPTLTLWGLDGFFVTQEKLFRKLYDCVRTLPNEEIDFSMDIEKIMGNDRPRWIKTVFSKTLLPFHGMLILVIVILTIFQLTI